MRMVMKDMSESNSIKDTIESSVFTIFHQLRTTASVKDKEEILEKNKDNGLLKALLEANLNPYRMFQFNKMPEFDHTINVSSKPVHCHFLELLEDLEKRKVTGNAAKNAVADVFKIMNLDEIALYSTILLKGPIGVGAKTVNKVWPGLVPVFDLMLAPNELPIVTQVSFPKYVQPKVDDYR